MKHLFISAGALSLLAMPISAADDFECMAQLEGSPGAAVVDSFVANYTMDTFYSHGPSAPFDQALAKRAEACRAQHGWSERATLHALLRELSRITQRAIRRNYADTAAIVDSIDMVLSDVERDRLWTILDGMVRLERPRSPTPADIEFFARTMNKLVPEITDRQRGRVGELMRMIALDRHAQIVFEAN